MIQRIRDWARGHTDARRYSPVGIAFHWIMAALILFQLGWGWHMGSLPVGAEKLAGYRIHAEIGLLMLVLATLRLIWRMIVPGPINDADRQGWQTVASHVTQILFYICFFGLPLSGWAMWSALGDGEPLRVAGLVPWPQMPFHDLDAGIQWAILDWAEGFHWLFVAALVVMVPIHIGAALKHHFWDKHDVLIGMLPVLEEDEAREAPRPGLTPSEPDPATMRC
ncbi:cytochrome b [Sphingomonas sp. G-3-2-10]|nr:cytochrome b [Sphingomonas sp. G-3-2-10]